MLRRPATDGPVLATTTVGLTEGLGLEVATPADARQLLELKGGDRVAF